LRERVIEHQQGEGQKAVEEAGSSLSRESDVGLNPRIPGSWPEPKAQATQASYYKHFLKG